MKKTGATSPTTFLPRELGAVRKQFGKAASDLVPARDVDPSGPRFQAAQLQHRISNAVREALLAQGKTLDEFAGEQNDTVPGMSYDRLVRVLRGETLMQIADLMTWAQHFDTVRTLLLTEQTWPVPASRTIDDAPTTDS